MTRSPVGWWRDEGVAKRLVCDLVTGELATLRPGWVSEPGWCDDSAHLVRDIGVDSMELVALATALSELLHLHESGIEDHLLVRPTIGEWATIVCDGLDAFSASLTFRTSGSTGTPRRCTHSLDTLWQEVETLAPLFFADRARVLLAVRTHHIYGFLFGVLLPRALGLPASRIVDLRKALPASLATSARDGDLVIGYPDFWRAVAQGHAALPSGVVGVTSTAPCPGDVALALETAGLTRLVQVYGSSETAGVGIRTDHRQPFSLLDFWRRSSGDANALDRLAPDGTWSTITLPDRLEWSGARTFLPVARVDEAVQVGGVNVHPDRVRRCLLEHPAIADAAVRLMRQDEGQRLKAFVVPREGHVGDAVLRDDIERWMASRLSTPERPRALTFGQALPVSASGKLADWSIDAPMRT